MNKYWKIYSRKGKKKNIEYF